MTEREPSDAEIERVAASMYEALSRDLKDKWPKATNGQKAVYRKQARAAILAMDHCRQDKDRRMTSPPKKEEGFQAVIEAREAAKGQLGTLREAMRLRRERASPPVPVVAVPEVTDGMTDAGAEAAEGYFAIDGDAGPWLRAEGYAAAFRAMLAARQKGPTA